jgi:hypothetical protein
VSGGEERKRKRKRRTRSGACLSVGAIAEGMFLELFFICAI